MLTKRLIRELKDIAQNPIQGISVEPLSDNIREWHFTILPNESSPCKGIPFHGHFLFEEGYPITPPKFYLHTRVYGNTASVSNVDEGYSICMSLSANWLKVHKEWTSDKTHGWRSTTTIVSFLIQIQSTIFDIDSDMLDYNYIETYRSCAIKYKCRKCGHDGSKMALYRPEIKIPFEYMLEYEEETSFDFNWILNLHDDMKKNKEWLNVVESVSKEDRHNIIVNNRFDTECYLSKSKLDEDSDDIFGICLNFRVSEYKDSVEIILSVDVPNISEYVCRRAYMEMNPACASNGEMTNRLLYLYFNEKHWTRVRNKFPNGLIGVHWYEYPEYFTRIFSNIKHNGIKNEAFFIAFTIINKKWLFFKNPPSFEGDFVRFYRIYQTLYQLIKMDEIKLPLEAHVRRIIKIHEGGEIMPINTLENYMTILLMLTDRDLQNKLIPCIMREAVYWNHTKYNAIEPRILNKKIIIKGQGKMIWDSIGFKAQIWIMLTLDLFKRKDVDIDRDLPDDVFDEWTKIEKSLKLDKFEDFFHELHIDEIKNGDDKWTQKILQRKIVDYRTKRVKKRDRKRERRKARVAK